MQELVSPFPYEIQIGSMKLSVSAIREQRLQLMSESYSNGKKFSARLEVSEAFFALTLPWVLRTRTSGVFGSTVVEFCTAANGACFARVWNSEEDRIANDYTKRLLLFENWFAFLGMG